MKRIGLWAGSSPAKAREVREGLARLKKLGLEPVIPPATKRWAARKESAARPFLAGPDQARARALASLWQRKDISQILAVRGGYGSLRLLPWLDRLRLKGKKRLWGFSDLTCVQNYLYARTGSAWIHAPMLTSNAFVRSGPAEAPYFKAPRAGQARTVEHRLRVELRAGMPARLKLPLIGGNLACFCALLGTRWEPRPKKAFILFLEDVNEEPYKVDRLLNQLAGSRVLERCRAVVTGHFSDQRRVMPVIRAWAREQSIPVLSGLRAGHERPNIPLPMGLAAEIRTRGSHASLHVERVCLPG